MTLTPLPRIPAATVRAWLADGQEIALLDVREAGPFGEGHPFLAVPLPYSRLEIDAVRLVPRRGTRIVLIDADDGVAERAAARLAALGYAQLHALDGGAAGWAAAGYTLFKGVNLPSKTFGERVEQAWHVPHLSAAELHARQAAGEPLVLLDGRTREEHAKMTIPGAVSVPNGELALRWRALVPDARTPIVVHCAGRTRSIVGAQILRDLGVPNPVLALENGTQGWALAGLPLERGSTREGAREAVATAADREAAARVARQAGVARLTAAQAQAWLDDATRTTYLLDVRDAREFAAGTRAGARHAPGGQLLQATDQFIGVRGARVLLLDAEDVRAPVVAAWLARLGWQTAVVEGGIAAPLVPRETSAPSAASGTAAPALPRVERASLSGFVAARAPRLLDLRLSLAHRESHPAGARWSVRPRLARDVAPPARDDDTLLLLIDDASAERAALAAIDLREAGWREIHVAAAADWTAAGLPVQSSPASPSDEQAIDYLFFVHDRHDGNLDAARAYLAWETGLIAQCAPDELALFRLPGNPQADGDVGARRRAAVRETLDDIRALLAGSAPTRETLDRVAARLERLAAQRALFPRAEFAPPAAHEGVGASTRYRLNPEGGDDDLALYLNSINPGKTTIPHNHTTWAVIVALEGEEDNRIYRRLDDGRDPTRARLELAREITVRPGTPVAFLPEDLHSIHAVGERPTLHFHLYGRPLETLSGRIGVDLDSGAVVNYNATQFKPSRAAA